MQLQQDWTFCSSLGLLNCQVAKIPGEKKGKKNQTNQPPSNRLNQRKTDL